MGTGDTIMEPTGTLAEQNEFFSDTPTSVKAIMVQVAMIGMAIKVIASELNDKVKDVPGPIDPRLEEETLARIEPLNRELERLLAIKRRLESR
jgi:hypothetical protein